MVLVTKDYTVEGRGYQVDYKIRQCKKFCTVTLLRFKTPFEEFDQFEIQFENLLVDHTIKSHTEYLLLGPETHIVIQYQLQRGNFVVYTELITYRVKNGVLTVDDLFV